MGGLQGRYRGSAEGRPKAATGENPPWVGFGVLGFGVLGLSGGGGLVVGVRSHASAWPVSAHDAQRSRRPDSREACTDSVPLLVGGGLHMQIGR